LGVRYNNKKYPKILIFIISFRFAPSIPIEGVTQMLAYQSNDICQKHLSTWGIILIDELSGASIDCKASRAIFEKK
jgi:hypothetical protein